MAPEQFEDEEHYGAEIDVYAFALLAYEIVTGKEPFNERGKQITALNLMKKIKTGCRPEFIDGIPEKMKDLISQCWSRDPKERPPFEIIFEKLSNDFSYLDETDDDDEISDYLKMLKENTNENFVETYVFLDHI